MDRITTSTATAEMFECGNCCETYKIGRVNKKIRCLGCEYETCNHCQKRYSKSECMACHNDFTKEQIETLLGKKFVDEVIKKQQIEDLIIDEKKLIPATEELINYNNEVERRKKLFRKGKTAFEEMPSRPTISNQSSIEPCSITNCKGYLRTNQNTKIYECMLCKKEHCLRCFVEIKNANHTCDPDTLKSLDELNRETKRCPKCHNRIYKTEGCDHMRCTSCGSHFSWNTGVLLAHSTNHHYNGVIRNQYAGNNGMCIQTYQDPAIPKDILEPRLSVKLINCLYNYPNKIRIYFNNDCKYEKILETYSRANDDLRIRYMKNEITEKYWGQRLYINKKTLKLKLAHREIIEIYLSGIDAFQTSFYNNEDTEEEVYKKVVALIIECNNCFNRVNDEYYYEKSETKFELALPEEENRPVLEKKIIKKTIRVVKKAPTKEPEPSKKVKLFEYQLEHYENIRRILETYKVGFDLSPLGAGKTYITCKYIQDHPHENVYIVCPATLKPKWTKVADEFGLKINVLTYNEVSSKKMKQPEHGLLKRDDFVETQNVNTDESNNTRDIEKVRFYATDKLIEMARKPRGIFVAFDEIQNIRNEGTNITRACREIMNEMYNNGVNSLLCISGTPIDKQEQFVTMYRNIGIQRDNSLYRMNLSTWINEPTGFNEIVDYCIKISEESSNVDAYRYSRSVKANPPRNVKLCYSTLHKLFIDVIKPILTSAIVMPERPQATITNYNTFYRLQGENYELCQKAIKKMLEIVDNSNGIFGETRIQLFKSMILLESAKISTFAEEIEYTLNTYPNSKVVVALSYTESIKELYELVKHWNPLCVNGEITAKKKHEYIDKFQKPDLEHRVLIGNINVISTGIDLDDKDGRFPRYVFVNPTFSLITLQQLSYRFLRSLDTKSATVIRHVYSDIGLDENVLENIVSNNRYHDIEIQSGVITNGTNIRIANNPRNKNVEFKIINALIKKSVVMKSVALDNVEMPDTYQCSLKI